MFYMNKQRKIYHSIIVVVIAMMLTMPLQALITLGAHTSGGSANSDNFTTSAISTINATLLVACVADRDGSTTFSDNQSNTWTATTNYNTTLSFLRFYYVANPTTNASHTFTVSCSGCAPTIGGIAAFTGTATTSVSETVTGATNTATTTLQPGSITPGANDYLLVSCYGGIDTYSSVSAPFTPAIEEVTVTGNRNASAFAYEIQTTATARNPTWTWSFATTATATMGSFKVATATSSAPSTLLLLSPGQ